MMLALTLTGCSEKTSDEETMTTSPVPPRELPDSANRTISGSFTLTGLGSEDFISEHRATVAQSIADVYGAPVQYVEVNVVSMSMRRLMPSSLRRLDNVVKVMFSITLPEASAPELNEKIAQTALEMSENNIRTALASVLPREIQVASVVLPVLSIASTTSATSDVMTTSSTTTKAGAEVHITTTTLDASATSTPKMSTTSMTLPTIETSTTVESSTSASATPVTTTTTTAGQEMPKTATTTTSDVGTTTKTIAGSTTTGQEMPKTETTTSKVGTSSTTPNLVSTEIAGSAEQGDTQIKTKSVAGFKLGMTIVIAPDTPRMEFNTVKAFGTIDLNSPLLFSHPAGTVVREKTSEDTTTSSNPCIATTTMTNPCVSVVRKFDVGYNNEEPLVRGLSLGGRVAVFAGAALAGILVVAGVTLASMLVSALMRRAENVRYRSMPKEEASNL